MNSEGSGADNNTLEAILEILSQIRDQGFHMGLFCYSAIETLFEDGIISALQLIKGLMSESALKHIFLVIT